MTQKVYKSSMNSENLALCRILSANWYGLKSVVFGMRRPDPCCPANAGISTSAARYVTLCTQAPDIRPHA